MFNIQSKVNKPNIELMETRVKEMCKRGIRISDVDKLQEEFSKVMEEIKEELQAQYNIENPNSPKQIAEFLSRTSDNFWIGEKNDIIDVCYSDGKWTSNADALKTLSYMGYEFADLLLSYRAAHANVKAVKQLSENSIDNVIYPEVSLLKTNRISYSKPALMSVPKKLLWYLIKPFNSDDVLYSVDIKNQEPAILINILGDEPLVEALKSENGLYNTMYEKLMEPMAKMYVLYNTFDTNGIKGAEECRGALVSPVYYTPERIHSESWYYNDKKVIAIETKCQGLNKAGKSEVLKPEEVLIEFEDKTVQKVKVTWLDEVEKISDGVEYSGKIEGLQCKLQPGERAEFKTTWLSITYGASVKGVEEHCKLIDGKLAYKRITSLKAFKQYRSSCTKAASNGVQTLHTYFGNSVSANKYERSQLKRSLLSIPIQGTGADLLALLIERFDQEKEKRFASYTDKPFIYYTRHDELIIEIPKQVMDTLGDDGVEQWLRETLEHTVNNWVPFKVEVNKIEDKDIRELLKNE